MQLRDDQFDELLALRMANDASSTPAFQHISNYDFYKPMADANLVVIGPPPGDFDPAKFIGVTITEAGRAAISSPSANVEKTKLLPMEDAKKDGRPILARIRQDLVDVYPSYGLGQADRYAGCIVVIRYIGDPNQKHTGWSLNGPFGHELGGDDVFDGWQHLPHIEN